jgi:hypothetical protein
MRVVIAVATLAGCAYHPGSFNRPGSPAPFPGKQATIGCVDLAVDLRPDYDGATVIEYSFGNRCNQPATIDLAAVAVWGTTESGEQRLYPFDPRQEIRPLLIEGRLYGHEVIAYPMPQPASRICIDVASVVNAEPAQWKCFSVKNEPVVAQGEP